MTLGQKAPTCKRTLAVSSGNVRRSAKQAAVPAPRNFTAIVGGTSEGFSPTMVPARSTSPSGAHRGPRREATWKPWASQWGEGCRRQASGGRWVCAVWPGPISRHPQHQKELLYIKQVAFPFPYLCCLNLAYKTRSLSSPSHRAILILFSSHQGRAGLLVASSLYEDAKAQAGTRSGSAPHTPCSPQCPAASCGRQSVSPAPEVPHRSDLPLPNNSS